MLFLLVVSISILFLRSGLRLFYILVFYPLIICLYSYCNIPSETSHLTISHLFRLQQFVFPPQFPCFLDNSLRATASSRQQPCLSVHVSPCTTAPQGHNRSHHQKAIPFFFCPYTAELLIFRFSLVGSILFLLWCGFHRCFPPSVGRPPAQAYRTVL